MHKILFVCLGNICRSPLAEGIMLDLKQKHNLNIQIDSAGTSSFHIGEAPDPRTIKNAKKNGVDLSQLVARQFVESDFDEFDFIFAMDQSNLTNIADLMNNKINKAQIALLTDLLHDNSAQKVPDPYYGTAQDFEAVFQLVLRCCEILTERIKNKRPLIHQKSF
ncbi:MAG: low molecular weight phosphotyrosine protein phosphatase [Sphingobacteriaceae bacterium]|nr:low molecular weight phosphotyrosine protein phosphatase [Sphingobacteriaceae bacterium]